MPATPGQDIDLALSELMAAATRVLGDNLVSATLFGSAAEGRLRRASDVNLLLVVKRVDAGDLAQLRPSLRLARAAIALNPMILAESELPEAASHFAEKFADMRVRHRVLAGRDVLQDLEVPRAALRARLSQSALNVALRLRRALAELPATGDLAARSLASFAGPLRACAHAFLLVEGAAPQGPRAALETVAGRFGAPAAALARLSEAREQGSVRPSDAESALRDLLALTESMRNALRGPA